MNYPTIYNPAVADRAQEALTDEMIRIVNQHSREAQLIGAARGALNVMQQAQAVQTAQHARNEALLRAQLRRARMWTGVAVDAALFAAVWLTRTNIHYALPLLMAAMALGGWLLGHVTNRKKV